MTPIDILAIVALIAIAVSWTVGHNMGWKAGRNSLETDAWERGYRRCLFVWSEEIMFWRNHVIETGMLPSKHKVYHKDIVTIGRDFKEQSDEVSI